MALIHVVVKITVIVRMVLNVYKVVLIVIVTPAGAANNHSKIRNVRNFFTQQKACKKCTPNFLLATLRHFGDGTCQTGNLARGAFFRHRFAGGLHHFAFRAAHRGDRGGLVPGCDGLNRLFVFCFNRTATRSVYGVLFRRDQDSFFR